MTSYFTRTPLAWVLIGLIAAYGVFYGFVAYTIKTAPYSESYRRTYMTGEFAVYPESTTFRPRNGLDYLPGQVIIVAEKPSRWYLSRREWWRFNPPTPFLKGLTGKVYLHIPDAARRPDKPHRLAMDFTCAMPKGRETVLKIEVNAVPVGEVACAQGSAHFETFLPAGLFPQRSYEELTISRVAPDFWERVATRLAIRFDAVALDRFVVSVVE